MYSLKQEKKSNLLSEGSSFSSNMVAIFNYSKETGFAYSRIYYAIGLLVAGYFADKNNKVFEIASISSLLFPLMTIILFKEQINMLMIANLNYFFISFLMNKVHIHYTKSI